MLLRLVLLALLHSYSSSLTHIKKVYFAGHIQPVQIGPGMELVGTSPSLIQFSQGNQPMALTTQLPQDPKTRGLILPRVSVFFGVNLLVGLTHGYVMFIATPFTSEPVLISMATPYAVVAVVGVPNTTRFFA